MIHELRAYDLQAGKAVAYLDLFKRAGVGYVTRHLPLAGYWMTESGALNRIYHLWIYRDLAERAEARVGLGVDRDWTEEFMPEGFPLIISQQTSLMRCDFASPELTAAVENRNAHHPNDPEGPLFADSLLALTFGQPGPASIGKWTVQSGRNVGQTVSLHRVDPASPFREASGAQSHELLRPMALSPLR